MRHGGNNLVTQHTTLMAFVTADFPVSRGTVVPTNCVSLCDVFVTTSVLSGCYYLSACQQLCQADDKAVTPTESHWEYSLSPASSAPQSCFVQVKLTVKYLLSVNPVNGGQPSHHVGCHNEFPHQGRWGCQASGSK